MIDVCPQVFGSLEVVLVGLANVVILQQPYSMSMTPPLVSLASSGRRSSSSPPASRPSKSPSRGAIIWRCRFSPVLLTIVSSGLSGISGVITEKLMKGKKDVSIFQQNIWLSLSRLWFVAIIVGAPCLTSSAWLWGIGRRFRQEMSLMHFNGYALLTVAEVGMTDVSHVAQ